MPRQPMPLPGPPPPLQQHFPHPRVANKMGGVPLPIQGVRGKGVQENLRRRPDFFGNCAADRDKNEGSAPQAVKYKRMAPQAPQNWKGGLWSKGFSTYKVPPSGG